MIERLELLGLAVLLTAAIAGALYLGAWLLARRRARPPAPAPYDGPMPPQHFNCRCSIVECSDADTNGDAS